MKKETRSAASVAKRIKLTSEQNYFVKTTPEQCFKLVMAAIEKGINVPSETQRYPFDSNFPYIIWEDECIYQTKQGTEHYDIRDNLEVVLFDDFMEAIKFFNSNKIRLNSDYEASVNEDHIIVGCQTIPFDKVKEIVALHKELYGEAE
jgi:hypothetical protein